MLANHLFVASDGCLHDTRRPNWAAEPLRTNYQRSHHVIRSVADLKATLRAGCYAWPGGYPMYAITSDGAALSFDTVLAEFRNVVDSIRHHHNDGWRVIGIDVNWEDGSLTDDHTGERIESAYAD